VNEAEVYDNIWTPSYWPTKYNYISLETYDFSLLHPSPDGALTEINIIMDSKYTSIQRQVYSIVQMLSDVGGIIGVLVPLGAFLVHVFNEKVYTMTMMSVLYQVKSKDSTNKIVPMNDKTS
jgi:hypothetical protein